MPDPSAVPVLNPSASDSGKSTGKGKNQAQDAGNDSGKGSSSSSSSVAAGSPPVGTDEGQGEQAEGLFCGTCKEPGRPSTLMFLHEWQFTLRCICYVCWGKQAGNEGKSEQVFVKYRKASWRQRGASQKSHLRGEKMAVALAETAREKDESVRDWKRRAIYSMAKFVATVARSFVKLDRGMQEKVIETFTKWEEEKNFIAENPGARASSEACCGAVLPDEALQMASEMMEGVSEWYLCRHIETWKQIDGVWAEVKEPCGFFAPAQYWATTDLTFIKGGHYRCPRCGNAYAPWMGRDKYIPANKLLTIEGSDEQVVEFWKGQIGGVAAGILPEGTPPSVEGPNVLFVPFWWAHSQEQALHNRLKELFLGLGEELQNVPVRDLPSRVAALALERQVAKAWWSKAAITPAARKAIDEGGLREKFHYDHLLEPFVQARYVYKAGVEVWDTDRLARAWGTVWLAIRATRRA